MIVQLDAVSKGRAGSALPTTDLRFETGIATLALTETEQRPTVLGLIASGRMRPDTGRVLVDGVDDRSRLRASVALVDTPIVSEPSPAVSLFGVVAEELMFAGRPSSPRAVLRRLETTGLRAYAGESMADLPPDIRIRALAELALLRDGVRALVITSPDRHGGAPAHWWGIAEEIAAGGVAVLVIAGTAAATALGKDAS